ncbi:MAG TPA: hypothetical protein VF717_09210 [Pyrinomonadaceae bacterium]|jgi:hypothetical protein
MNLTPEERRRIYEEEKARINNEEQATRRSWTLFLLLIFVLVVGALAVIYFLAYGKSGLNPTTDQTAGASSKGAQPNSTNNTQGLNAEIGSTEEGVGRLEKAEYGFKAEDGCRDLYYRMRDDGDQSAEAIARNMQEADKSITYNQVMKNPIPFYGKPIVITGRIYQIFEYPADDGKFFTDVLMNWGRDYVMVSVVSQTPFVKGDRIVVVGYLAKHLYQYKSVAQWDVAVPLIVARAILKPNEAAKLKPKK